MYIVILFFVLLFVSTSMDFQYTVGKFRNFDKSVFYRSRLNEATDGARAKSLDKEFQMGATRWAQ